MKIAYFVDQFPKLSETFVTDEILGLIDRGHVIRIFALKPSGEDWEHPAWASRLKHRTSYGLETFADKLAEFDPDIVHAHFATFATGAALSAGAGDRWPLTFTAHRYDIYDSPPDDMTWRAERAAAVITVSEANRRFMVEQFSVPHSKINVVPCGVDVGVLGRKVVVQRRKPRLLVIARLHEVKNVDVILAAAANLADGGLEFTVTVLGDGPERQHLERFARELGLDDTVEFVGWADHAAVKSWLAMSDGLVLASRSEGYPVSLMEAAAAGLPVIATPVGGVPELVDDGVTGSLVPVGDVEALSAAMQWLLNDEADRHQMGAAARAKAVRAFDQSLQLDRLELVWGRVLGMSARTSIVVGEALQSWSGLGVAVAGGR